MGLDMYLIKRVYVGQRFEHRNVSGNLLIKQGASVIADDIDGLKELVYDVGYWRKANQIHKWFVDNVQNGDDDCNEYYVSRTDLKNLRETCSKVLANHDLASGLLPSQSGFFFGGTEYDEYYFNDLTETISIIDKALQDETSEFCYRASW